MTEKTNQDEFKITSTMWFDLVKSIAVLTERMDAQIAATNALRGDMTQQISLLRAEMRFYLKLYVVLATVFGGAVVAQIGMFFA